MKTKISDASLLGTAGIGKLLLKIAPPVMLAQLIQALYNVVDSFFVGKFSPDGLTALSVIFPVQLLITALAVGTGVGVNTYMARRYAHGDRLGANRTAGAGFVLAVMSWACFALLSYFLMPYYVQTSAKSPLAVDYAIRYGNIVCVGSLGTFLEAVWSKVHQAGGNMRLPMIAQIIGAAVNVALDYVLIFGAGILPALGIDGAAYATVAGQVAAAAIVGVKAFHIPPPLKNSGEYVKNIYRLGYPSIMQQALYTVYIVVLNVILSGFSDAAVTVLGLYYKLQTFFFIPLMGLSTCIVPALSYNFENDNFERCKKITNDSLFVSAAFMIVGIICFEALPARLIGLFSSEAEVLKIGVPAFRIIGTSFISAVFSLMLPVFFQAIGASKRSTLLSFTRQILCLMPIFWLFSLIGLEYAWIAFPVSETIAGGAGLILYIKQLVAWKKISPQSA